MSGHRTRPEPVWPDSNFSASVGYGRNGIDRLAELRDRDDALARLQNEAGAQIVLFVGDAPLIRGEHPDARILYILSEIRANCPFGDLHLLGKRDETPIFASRIADAAQPPSGARAADLRSLAVEGALPAEELGLLAQAKTLLQWHERHSFCANCGSRSSSAAGGWRRECRICGAHHFPRTDPVAIMLAVDGERCLLGRQARFAAGMYSALAGFVEPGETLEDAVRREVREEAGVEIGRVAYVGSQPWPFPANLMLGCLAEALSTELTIDGAELEDARWFSRDEALAMIEGRHPDGLRPPNPIAIAHGLLRHWLSR